MLPIILCFLKQGNVHALQIDFLTRGSLVQNARDQKCCRSGGHLESGRFALASHVVQHWKLKSKEALVLDPGIFYTLDFRVKDTQSVQLKCGAKAHLAEICATKACTDRK